MTREDEMTNSLMEIREFADLYIHPLDDYSVYSQLIDLIDASISLNESYVRKVMIIIPDDYQNINQNAFNEWMSYKKYKNKGAITKTLNMLNKYSHEVQQEMVDLSIGNEYKGLFPPKKKFSCTENNINVAKSWLDENDFHEMCKPKVIGG